MSLVGAPAAEAERLKSVARGTNQAQAVGDRAVALAVGYGEWSSEGLRNAD